MDEITRDKKIDKITDRIKQLDEICASIYLPLMSRTSLRYNELFRTVNRLNPKQKDGKDFISKPTFDAHLKHLTKSRLVVVNREGKQNVTYSLNKDAISILSDEDSSEGIEEWIKRMEVFEVIKPKEHYSNLSEKALEQEINKDLNLVLENNLLEIRAFVNYELKIDDQQTDSEFWNFVGNPMYRMFEKLIANNCRESPEYKTKFFEKIEYLVKNKALSKALNKKPEA